MNDRFAMPAPWVDGQHTGPGSIRRLLGKWMSGTAYEISDRELRIVGTMYGRSVPRDALQLDRAAMFTLEKADPRNLALRTNGIGLPGYKAGWFTLRSGERALVFLSDPTRTVYIPTSAGYALLLSVDDPQGFLDRLKG